MSKTSTRRPGQGYNEGWERIFGRKSPLQQIADLVRSGGWIPMKVNDIDLPITMGCEDDILPTCGNCAYWNPSPIPAPAGICGNNSVKTLTTDGFFPPADFACGMFEAKS